MLKSSSIGGSTESFGLRSPLDDPAKPVLQVVLAQPRGFCAGVVRAIEIVERALMQKSGPVYVRHEIVHNKHVVERLESLGARFVEELDQVPDGATTVFSAHGVPKAVELEAESRKLRVQNATCPLVTKVHSQCRRYVAQGRTVILIGHAGHPEVIGTMGQISAPVHLIACRADVRNLDVPRNTPIAYVTQTTLSVDDTRDIIAELRARFPDTVGPETRDICYATQNRQRAVRDLCTQVEMLLVIGARNSSNSTRLFEIGSGMGIPTHFIADHHDIKPAWIEGIASVGITAGASAPESVVQNVVDALSAFRQIEVSTLSGREEAIRFDLPPL